MAICCPKCGGKSFTLETRTRENGNNQAYRRKKCRKCSNKFSTLEVLYDDIGRITPQPVLNLINELAKLTKQE